MPQTTYEGRAASYGTWTGPARILKNPSLNEIERVQDGDVLVAPETNPDYVPAMERAGAIVTASGGITCHAAIVARELGKPAVVACGADVLAIPDGATVEVDGTSGLVRLIA